MRSFHSFEFAGFEQGDITFLSPDTCMVEIWFDFMIDGVEQDESFQVFSKLIKSPSGEAYDWRFYEQGFVDHEEVKQFIHGFYRDGSMQLVENVLKDASALSSPSTAISHLIGEKHGDEVDLAFTLPSGSRYTFEFKDQILQTIEVIDHHDNYSFYIKKLAHQEKVVSYLMNESNQRLLFVC